MLRKSLIALLLFGSGITAEATHMSGGEIYWECIGNNQWRIKLLVYRDCAGINVDPSYNLVLTSPCGNRNLTVTTPGGVEISQLCDIELPNSTCNGGSLPGIQQYIYTGTITLPPCDSWHITWTNIYRNNAIVNLTNPGTREMFIEGVLNSTAAPCNNSPTFTNTAIPYVCLGYPVSYSYGAVDAESDSLSYSLIGARMLNGAAVPYAGGYTPVQPIPGITLDPVTGLLNFTLNVAGNWVVVVLVTEYDAAGNVIGTIMRDMQFVAYPCANIPPDPATGLTSNITGAAVQTGPRSVEVCESGDFCFEMTINDANLNNVLTAFTNIQQNLPGATFSYTGSNPITATVCWTAQAGTAGFYPFIVNVNDGACPIPAFQTYVYSVRVLPGLAATLAVTDEACLGTGDGTVTPTVTAGTAPYTYSWSTGASSASITAGPGSYSVTISDINNCVSPPLTGVIGTAGLPNTANAGPDLVGCPNALPIQLSGSVVNATGGTWSGGSGTITGPWATAQYTPSTTELNNGSAQLILTSTGNTTCPPGTDTILIQLPNSFATQAISGTNVLCNGGSSGTATFSPNNPTFTYIWDDPLAQTSATATGLPAGSYTVQANDTYGCGTQMTIAIVQPVVLSIANITSTPEACSGMGNGTATVTAAGGTPPYTYLWSNSAITASITATAGTYTVSVSDAHGCTPVVAQSVIATQGLPNQADAGPDQVGCMNSNPIALQGAVQNATGGIWSGGNGVMLGSGLGVQYTPSTAEIVAGGVDLILTTTGNSTCAADADTVHIALSNSFLNAQLATTNALCNGASNGSIATLPGNPSFSYQWNDPAQQTTSTATGLAGGTYTVTMTDVLGCDTSLSATIGQPGVLAIASLNSTNVTCAGGTNGSAVLTISGGTPAYTISWTNGQNGTSANGLSAGTYSVSVTDSHGCAAQGSTTITAPQPITLTADSPDTVCVNVTVQLTAQAQGGSGGYVYNWGSLGSNPTIQAAFSTSQVVSVTVSDLAGCAGPTVQLPITVLNLSEATLTTHGDTTVCPGGAGIVSASLDGYPGNYTITWPGLGTTGTGPFTVPIPQDQNVQVVVTDQCNNTLTGMVALRLQTPPNVVLPPLIAEGCAPLTVHFPNLGLGNVSILWDLGNGSTSTQAAPVVSYPAGTYSASLTVTTPLGCTASSPSYGQIIVHQPPTAAFSASPWITDYDHALVQFTDESSGSVTAYAWTFGDGGTSSLSDPAYHFSEVGVFDVELWVVDENGCEATATHEVEITPVYDIEIPTAFTPGSGGGNGGGWITGDLSNDVFYPFVRFVDDFRMRVFNRWGELIFESTDLKIGWDGYYRGELSPQDVYVVQTWFHFVDGKQVQKLTDLTLLR